MKKALLLIAAVAAYLGVSAQQTYNYFEAADVDADGWLWLDSKDKLKKYCGFNTKTKTYKIQLTAANYMVVDPDLDAEVQPEPETSATVKGYNAEGVQGGEGSKTGGIVLPIAKGFHYMMSNTSFGGGIALTLPDLAELSLYLSVDQKEAFMAVKAADGAVRYQDTGDIVNYWHGEGIQTLHQPVPGINFCGIWENIQDSKGYNMATESDTFITHEPGKPVTLYLPSLTDGHKVIIQGIKLLTYTNTNSNSAVDEIGVAADENSQSYNLFGQPVDDSYKGIVIKNGKKIIRK